MHQAPRLHFVLLLIDSGAASVICDIHSLAGFQRDAGGMAVEVDGV